MKNLIYQYFIPYNKSGEKPIWVDLGMNSAKKYADKINCEYMYYDKKYLNATLNVFESFRLIFDKTFDEYDNILLLDIDMLIRTEENIFDIEFEDIAMVHEYGARNRPPVPGASFDETFWRNYFYDLNRGVISYAKKYLNPNFVWKKSKLYPKDPMVIYNGGFQLWSKEGRLKARKLFKRNGHDHFKQITGKGETPYLNMMLIHHKFKVTELPIEWNKLNFQWKEDGDLGKITHYNDVVKNKMIEHGT